MTFFVCGSGFCQRIRRNLWFYCLLCVYFLCLYVHNLVVADCLHYMRVIIVCSGHVWSFFFTPKLQRIVKQYSFVIYL